MAMVTYNNAAHAIPDAKISAILFFFVSCVLWLKDTSYSKTVWRSEEEVPS